jgi:hypothetical protein
MMGNALELSSGSNNEGNMDGMFSTNQLSWLAGRWQGDHEGGQLDEHWLDPGGGTMMCVSRLIFGGKTASAEFMLIEERVDGLYLTIMLPRSGRQELLRAAHLRDGEVVFKHTNPEKAERLTYRREGDGSLYVLLEKEKEGRPVMTEFRMGRIVGETR